MFYHLTTRLSSSQGNYTVVSVQHYIQYGHSLSQLFLVLLYFETTLPSVIMQFPLDFWNTIEPIEVKGNDPYS